MSKKEIKDSSQEEVQIWESFQPIDVDVDLSEEDAAKIIKPSHAKIYSNKAGKESDAAAAPTPEYDVLQSHYVEPVASRNRFVGSVTAVPSVSREMSSEEFSSSSSYRGQENEGIAFGRRRRPVSLTPGLVFQEEIDRELAKKNVPSTSVSQVQAASTLSQRNSNERT
jgi:hypothetical protein